MANYNIPEGFSFDEGSGYYYQSVVSQDQSGNQIQLVTWFNPQTGESVQQRYPETGEPIQQEYSEAEGSIQQNNSEIEFSYDETSGLYYKIEEGNNAAGKRIQSVTWYNPQTGEYQVVETEIERTAQKEELVNGPQRVSYREKENITRKEDANKVKGKTIAIIIALFLVAANVVTACMYSIPYYKDNKDAIMALIGKKDEMVSKEIVAEGNTFRARQQGEARNQNTDTEEIEEGNMQNTLSSKDTYIWPDFAHASIFYMMADEDEEYIYFLYQPNMEWKNADVKSLTGSIYRMKKGDASSEQQLILSVNKNGIESIASFTLAGDYIYFSVMESPNNYSYYRIPKEGGTSEYLFEGGFSYLDADYGVVFCNFFETGEIGSYDESDQSFLLMSQIDWLGGFDAMAGAHQSFSVYAPFSVLDGKMYLGGEVDSISYYGYYDFELGKLVKTNSAYLQEDEFNYDYGNLHTYGFNALYFRDGVTLVDEYGGAVPVRLDQNIFAYGSTYTVDFMKIPDNDSSDMMSWEYCEDYWISTEDVPFTVCGNYLFYMDRIYNCQLDYMDEFSYNFRTDIVSNWDTSGL